MVSSYKLVFFICFSNIYIFCTLFFDVDFDECVSAKYHDCSDNAYCFNLRGTYTCSCREGYVDLSENSLYPGRVCSAELMGCDQCHYHGVCLDNDDESEVACDCFDWYAGKTCQYNLKGMLSFIPFAVMRYPFLHS